MKLSQRLADFFPSPNVCLYYFLGSLSFIYLYYHQVFYDVTFYEKNMGGLYYILSFEAIKPIQYRLLIPFIFKAIKIIFPFAPDKAVFFVMITVIMFFTLVLFYNVLNFYFADKKINSWLALVLIYPMAWNYLILNQMFEFTDFANLFFTFAAFYLILKKRNILLLLTFFIGGINHYSIGFLIVMYVLFNLKDLFKPKTIIYTAAMALIFILQMKIFDFIFAANTGFYIILHYDYNFISFAIMPANIVIRNTLMFFGGMHLFILYFFISGRWKAFNTKYLYINLTIIPYVIIIFLIQTSLEARNYITAIPFVTILFLMFFSTQKNSFLKPLDAIKSQNPS